MAETMDMPGSERFTIGTYFQTLTRLLASPRAFFSEMPAEGGWRHPLCFLFLSSLFFTGASLTVMREHTLLMAGVLFVNAMGMSLISTGAAFVVMTMTLGKRASLGGLFAVFAYAAGVTMLASWIPFFVRLTEPWKWALVVLGLVKGCRLEWFQAILIAAFSIVVLILFFWSLAPFIGYVRGLS